MFSCKEARIVSKRLLLERLLSVEIQSIHIALGLAKSGATLFKFGEATLSLCGTFGPMPDPVFRIRTIDLRIVNVKELLRVKASKYCGLKRLVGSLAVFREGCYKAPTPLHELKESPSNPQVG